MCCRKFCLTSTTPYYYIHYCKEIHIVSPEMSLFCEKIYVKNSKCRLDECKNLKRKKKDDINGHQSFVLKYLEVTLS